MAEGGIGTSMKYSCACGLSQDYRRKPFAGKCPHCRTRLKFLREQSSFDSGSAAVGDSLSPQDGPLMDPPEYEEMSSTDGQSGFEETRSRPERHKHPRRRHHEGRRHDQLRRPDSSSSSSNRRRSRSVERYDQQRVGEPPPYNLAAEVGHQRLPVRPERSRRSDSEGPSRRRRRVYVGPPPSYESAQNFNPPSYEEALVSSMSGLSTHSSLNTMISTSPGLRARSAGSTDYLDSSSELLRQENVLLEEHQAGSRAAERGARNPRRSRQSEREMQRQREREIQEEMERERNREMELAQYCGCSKCQNLYYSQYYDEAANDGATLPMETQVIMHNVLADGMALCSLM